MGELVGWYKFVYLTGRHAKFKPVHELLKVKSTIFEALPYSSM